MEDTPRQQYNIAWPPSMPLLADQSGFKGAGVSLLGCPSLLTVGHWVSSPWLNRALQSHHPTSSSCTEPSSSLPCHMVLLLIVWKLQRCQGWTHGFSSANISLAGACTKVPAQMTPPDMRTPVAVFLESSCCRGGPRWISPVVLLDHMCCKLFSDN